MGCRQDNVADDVTAEGALDGGGVGIRRAGQHRRDLTGGGATTRTKQMIQGRPVSETAQQAQASLTFHPRHSLMKGRMMSNSYTDVM